MSPAANAPMMSAVPARSARTQSSSRNAKADTTRMPRTRIRSTTPNSRGASFSPIHRATNRNATATPRMRTAPCRLNAVPAASPETTPRITSPMTSSITAAPRIRRASKLCSTWRSLSTRPVIPTEVAVRVAPTKRAVVSGSAAVCSYPCQPERQYRKPRTNGTATPTTATAVAAVPTRIVALRSVSSPISNNSTTTPTWASSRNTGVSGSSAPIGMTLRNPAPSRMPARSSPITAGCPRRSNASPANFAASSMIANTVKKRATSISPAAPSTRGRPAARAHRGGLKRLRRLGMEVEGVIEQRELDRLAVLGLDHDLPRRRPPRDFNLLGLGRETDILRGGLDAAADRAVVQGVDELLESDLAARGFLGRRVVAGLTEPLPLPQRLAFPLIENLDVDADLDLALRDIGAALARPVRCRHIGVVAGDLAAHHRVRVALPRDAEPEPTLERFEHRVVHFLRERRLGGLVVERQDGDGLDVRQAAAGEAVQAAAEREAERANGARAKSQDRAPRPCPPRPP